MKYYVIAGEASGDLHGSYLVRGLRRVDPAARIRGWGGDLMARQGVQLDVHYRDTAFMGFVEVVRNLPAIVRLMARCKRDIEAFGPDVLLLIDYPGFNLRMARWARKRGMRVFYYISPQVWAWKEGRVATIRRAVDRMFVILPFEPEFYARHGVEVTYFGHPLVDEVHDFFGRHAADRAAFAERHQLAAERPIVALLPGSRPQEIVRSLKVMLAVACRQPQRQFVVAGAPAIAPDYYRALMAHYAAPANVCLVHGQTWPLLAVADAALVTSGTATLETALFGVPQVVCYRGSRLSYLIARRLIKVPFISLVNLIAERQLVTELIQDAFVPERTAAELDRLFEEPHREAIRAGYDALRQSLGRPGVSERIAKEMYSLLARKQLPHRK